MVVIRGEDEDVLAMELTARVGDGERKEEGRRLAMEERRGEGDDIRVRKSKEERGKEEGWLMVVKVAVGEGKGVGGWMLGIVEGEAEGKIGGKMEEVSILDMEATSGGDEGDMGVRVGSGGGELLAKEVTTEVSRGEVMEEGWILDIGEGEDVIVGRSEEIRSEIEEEG